MIRLRPMRLTTLAILATTTLVPGKASAGGPLGWGFGWGHCGMGHHGVVVGTPVQGAGLTTLTSPLTGASAGVMTVTSPLSTASFGSPLSTAGFGSPLSTASFGSPLAGAGLASVPVTYYAVTPYATTPVQSTTSPLSTASMAGAQPSMVSAPAAAPITSPLGATAAATGSSQLSLAGVDRGSIIAEYNRFAEQERASALSQASVAGVGMAGVTVAASELNGLNTLFPDLAQKVGGVGNLHGIIRFLRTKTGNRDDFQKSARGLFGEVLGGALRQAPEVALNLFGNSIDTMIRQYIPGFSLFSQQTGDNGGGAQVGGGGAGSSPSNPLYVVVTSNAGGAGPPAQTNGDSTPPPPDSAPTVVEFIRSKVKSLQVDADGTMTGETKAGKKFRISPGKTPELID